MVESLRQAALERERRKKLMEDQEKERASEEVFSQKQEDNILSNIDVEMTDTQQQNNDDGDDNDNGWGNEEDDDDAYGDEWDAALEGDDENQEMIDQAMRENELQSKLKEVTITYKPDFFIDSKILIAVVGEFTQWIPENMHRYVGEILQEKPELKDTFYYTFKVPKGYKYRYHFQIGDELINDPKAPISENDRGKETNFIEVEGDDGELISEDLIKGLESEGLSLNKMTSYKEAEVPSELVALAVASNHQATMNRELLKRLMEDHAALIQDLRKYRDALDMAQIREDTQQEEEIRKIMVKKDTEFKEKSQEIKVQLQGRIIEKIMTLGGDKFECKEYVAHSGRIVLRKLMDNNGILIAGRNANTRSVQQVQRENFFKDYIILDREREIAFRKENMMSPDHVIVVKYKIMTIQHRQECVPQEVLPKHLYLKDYIINFNNQKKVTNVINRIFGEVKFQAFQIDESSGYVMGSVICLWTNRVKEGMLNIMHMHVNDTSDEVSMEVVYMADKQTAEDFQKFENDATGRPLRYKVLVKNMKIVNVLYNTGQTVEEVPFEEKRIKEGDLFAVENIPGSDEPMFGKVQYIPTKMVACETDDLQKQVNESFVKNDPITNCNMRCFVKLPGLVDFEIQSMDNLKTISDTPMCTALPICLCVEPTEMQLAMRDSLLQSIEQEKKNQALTIVTDYEQCINDGQANLEPQEYMNKLQEYEDRIDSEITENYKNDEEVMQRVQDLQSKASQIKRKLALEIRMNKNK